MRKLYWVQASSELSAGRCCELTRDSSLPTAAHFLTVAKMILRKKKKKVFRPDQLNGSKREGGEERKSYLFLYKIKADLSGCRSLVLRSGDELVGDGETLTGNPETADPFNLTFLSPKTSKTPPRPFLTLSTAKFAGFCSEKTGRSPALFSVTGEELAKSHLRQQQPTSA